VTAFNVAGIVVITLAWVWIVIAMRRTWPTVRVYLHSVRCWLTCTCERCGSKALYCRNVPGIATCEDCGHVQ